MFTFIGISRRRGYEHSSSRTFITLFTYKHNWSIQPLSQNYYLVYHTTYVECLNFMQEWRYLQFNVDSERQIFETLLIVNSFTLKVFARNLLRGNIFRRRNIFIFSFWCLIWDLKSGLRPNKPTHYLLDHGNFLLCHIRGKAKQASELVKFSQSCVKTRCVWKR